MYLDNSHLSRLNSMNEKEERIKLNLKIHIYNRDNICIWSDRDREDIHYGRCQSGA